jgi:hypothetical protein
MRASAQSLIIVAATLGAAPVAQAQLCCYEYTYYSSPAPRIRYRAGRHYSYKRPLRWSLGGHLTGVGTSQEFDGDPVALGGGGAHLRYRGFRWGAELSADILGASFLDGGAKRISVPIQASALLYLIPQGVFNLYLLGGAQVVPNVVNWDLPNLSDEQSFFQIGAQAGVGAELNLGRFVALTGDVRLFGLVRSDSGPAGSYYQGVDDEAIVPKTTAGAQLNLGVSFRF